MLVTTKPVTTTRQEAFINYLTQGLLLRKGLVLAKNDIKRYSSLLLKLTNNKKLIIKNQQLFCTNKSWLLLNQLIIDTINNSN